MDDLEKGDRVLVKHQTTGRWNKEAEIIKQIEDKLSYVIRDDTGQILARGRRLLKAKPAPSAKLDRVLRSMVRQLTKQDKSSTEE